MALETATYISDLNTSNPDGSTDTVSTLDDHVKLIKSTLKTTFPNVTGAVTPTHTVLNYMLGVTSAVQTQLDAKAALVSPALSGAPTAPTAAAGTSTTQIATTAFVAATAFTTATGLPAASQAEMETGTEAALRAMSPLRVAQAVSAQRPASTQTQMEAASSNAVMATPGTVNWHPGVAKAWIKCDAAGAIAASHNVTSITDDGTGLVTVTIGTDFSSANYAIVCSAIGSATVGGVMTVQTQAAGAFQLGAYASTTGNAADPTAYFAVCYGDQA